MTTVIEAEIEAVESSPRSGILAPLDESSTVKTINLFDRQWSWLDDQAQITGLNRSQIVRKALDAFKADIDAAIAGTA